MNFFPQQRFVLERTFFFIRPVPTYVEIYTRLCQIINFDGIRGQKIPDIAPEQKKHTIMRLDSSSLKMPNMLMNANYVCLLFYILKHLPHKFCSITTF